MGGGRMVGRDDRPGARMGGTYWGGGRSRPPTLGGGERCVLQLAHAGPLDECVHGILRDIALGHHFHGWIAALFPVVQLVTQTRCIDRALLADERLAHVRKSAGRELVGAGQDVQDLLPDLCDLGLDVRGQPALAHAYGAVEGLANLTRIQRRSEPRRPAPGNHQDAYHIESDHHRRPEWPGKAAEMQRQTPERQSRSGDVLTTPQVGDEAPPQGGRRRTGGTGATGSHGSPGRPGSVRRSGCRTPGPRSCRRSGSGPWSGPLQRGL